MHVFIGYVLEGSEPLNRARGERLASVQVLRPFVAEILIGSTCFWAPYPAEMKSRA
ncbi:hypothetical protein [Sphingomonas suaedae]|uniref:hypothetical protein n=1 Tax=Sphingomonas suaedae TaxID=2599297 RepID=UPI0016440F1C|nr:hypothetical protein [Sphingomonas suaedae]